MPFDINAIVTGALPPVPGPTVAAAAPEPGPPPGPQPYDVPPPRAVTERPPAQVFQYFTGVIAGAGTENILEAGIVPEYWIVILAVDAIVLDAIVNVYEPYQRPIVVQVSNAAPARRVYPAKDHRFVLTQAGGLGVKYEVYAVSGYNPGPVA